MEPNPDINPYATPMAPLTEGQAALAAQPVLWNPDAAGLWSLPFSPLFGSILVLMNWQAIGAVERVRSAWVWVALSVVSLVASVFFQWLPLLFLIIWYFAQQRQQTAYVKERWGDRYPRRDWGVPILLGVAGRVALITIAYMATG